MKALKFRIYDKDAKKFHYLEGVFNMPDPCYDGEVQQFTGLLDRLGVEIYEGDIVKWQGENRVVSYCNSYSCGRYELDLHEEGRGGVLSGEPENWLKTEVIGNIYENPREGLRKKL